MGQTPSIVDVNAIASLSLAQIVGCFESGDSGWVEGRGIGKNLRTIGSPVVNGAICIGRDADVATMYESVVIATFGDEILDIVVTAEGPMMAMVDLHDCCRAPGPGAGAMAGVHGSTLLRCDGDGAASEVERIAVTVLEDG